MEIDVCGSSINQNTQLEDSLKLSTNWLLTYYSLPHSLNHRLLPMHRTECCFVECSWQRDVLVCDSASSSSSSSSNSKASKPTQSDQHNRTCSRGSVGPSATVVRGSGLPTGLPYKYQLTTYYHVVRMQGWIQISQPQCRVRVRVVA
jgi:hypothetical protein